MLFTLSLFVLEGKFTYLYITFVNFVVDGSYCKGHPYNPFIKLVNSNYLKSKIQQKLLVGVPLMTFCKETIKKGVKFPK